MGSRRNGASVTAAFAVLSALGLLVLVGAGRGQDQDASSSEVVAAVAPPDSSTTTTTTTTTTTVATTGASEPGDGIDPRPLSVTASTTVVGAGGVVTFRGICPAVPSDVLLVVIIGPAGEQVTADLVDPAWTFEWVAPVDPALIGSHSFQFWCGDTAGWEGQYPDAQLLTVDMVAQAAVTTTLPAATTTTSVTTVTAVDVLPATS